MLSRFVSAHWNQLRPSRTYVSKDAKYSDRARQRLFTEKRLLM